MSELGKASQHFQEGTARICTLYGVNPLAGRLFAVLFLSVEPVSLEDLCRRVSSAKSTVSVALRTLLGARVVRRLPRKSDRRDYYEAVADPWEILADWNRLFVQPELEMWRETGEELERALRASDAPRVEREALRERLETMASFVTVMEEMLAGLMRPRSGGRARARTIAIDVRKP